MTTASATQDLVLALDVGSSSLRAQLFTSTGEGIEGCEAHARYVTRYTPDGGTEVEPLSLLDSLSDAIDRALSCVADRRVRIVGVGMCSQVANLMGIDGEGIPTTPIYTWSDLRGAEEARELLAQVSQDDFRERTGANIHTSTLPVRLLWLKRNRPDAYARTERWVSLGDWLYAQFFGRLAQSLSVASWGGLLNRHSLDWDAETLSLLQLPQAALPPLTDADSFFTGLRSPYRERWPALADLPWSPCIGDGAGGNVGSGCFTPDAVAVQVGTSGAVRVVMPGVPKEIPAGLWCYRIDGRDALLGGSLSGGANTVRWLEAFLGREEWERASHEAERMDPCSHGLNVLPFVAGERSPGWLPDARGVLAGFHVGTTPAHLLRALQEAVAYRFALVFDTLAPALPGIDRVVAGGGDLLGPHWTPMLADVLGRPVTELTDMQASSRGVAMLVFRYLGKSNYVDARVPLGETHQPDMQRHKLYRAGMDEQGELYRMLYAREV
jgi:gluconokinase